jgi:hypothetical protein
MNWKACFGGGIRSSGLKLRDPRVVAALVQELRHLARNASERFN